MLTSWESVVVELTGKRSGHGVEFTMHDDQGQIGEMWWTYSDNIIKQRSS
jgi:hypothetical protein